MTYKIGEKQYKHQWYLRNRERILEKRQEYREKNLEYIRSWGRMYNKQKRNIDPELAKRRARGYALKRKYGITLEQYEELLKKQNGCCAICEKNVSENKKSLAVDHNHATGEIRGLLCTHCNHRLVGRHKDGELLRKIADYIEQGTGWLVPPKTKKKRKKYARGK